MWPELRTILMSYICHLFALDTNHIIISSTQEEDYPIVDVLRLKSSKITPLEMTITMLEFPEGRF